MSRSPTLSPAADPVPTATAANGAGPTWSRRHLLVLLAITGLGGLLRLWRLEQCSLGPREAENWAAAVGWLGDGWQPTGSPASHLLQFLLGTGLLPAHGEGWLRLPFAFLGIVTVPVLGLVAQRFVAPAAALLAAALLAVHPLHVQCSQTADGAVLAAAMTVLAAGLLAVLPARGRWLALVTLLAAFWLAPWRAAAIAGSSASVVLLRPACLLLAAAAVWLWRREPEQAERAGLRDARLLAVVAFAPLVLVMLLGLLVPVGSGVLAASLPALVCLAGHTLLVTGRLVHTAVMRWQPDALPWAAAVPTGLLGAMLFADAGVQTFLGVTVHRGQRPDLRTAANFVLRSAAGQPCEVRADGNLPGLVYYLQPDPRDRVLRLLPLTAPATSPPQTLTFVVAHPERALAWRAAWQLDWQREHPDVPTPRFELARVVAQPHAEAMAGADPSLYVLRRRVP